MDSLSTVVGRSASPPNRGLKTGAAQRPSRWSGPTLFAGSSTHGGGADERDPNRYAFGDDDFDYTWESMAGLKEFFVRAAEAGRPVLFCSVLFCSVLFCSVLFCSVLFTTS
jgi:hypothetical protein